MLFSLLSDKAATGKDEVESDEGRMGLKLVRDLLGELMARPAAVKRGVEAGGSRGTKRQSIFRSRAESVPRSLQLAPRGAPPLVWYSRVSVHPSQRKDRSNGLVASDLALSTLCESRVALG